MGVKLYHCTDDTQLYFYTPESPTDVINDLFKCLEVGGWGGWRRTVFDVTQARLSSFGFRVSQILGLFFCSSSRQKEHIIWGRSWSLNSYFKGKHESQLSELLHKSIIRPISQLLIPWPPVDWIIPTYSARGCPWRLSKSYHCSRMQQCEQLQAHDVAM